MNDLEISIVLRFIEDHLFEPGGSWSRQVLKERAYSRWAAYEIVRRLMDHPFDPVEVTIESFIFELIGAEYLAKNDKTAGMFSVAQDTAEDILCLLT